jgi:hypothetical protein
MIDHRVGLVRGWSSSRAKTRSPPSESRSPYATRQRPDDRTSSTARCRKLSGYFFGAAIDDQDLLPGSHDPGFRASTKVGAAQLDTLPADVLAEAKRWEQHNVEVEIT